MSSSPAALSRPPRIGPTFAVINDVDRQIEEELGLDPPAKVEEGAMLVDEGKNVDEEIDELLSDEDMEEEMAGVSAASAAAGAAGSSGKGRTSSGRVKGPQGWVCRWDECWQDLVTQDALVEHVQVGCNKTFTRSDALTKHLRSLHGITPDLPQGKKKPKDPTAILTTQPLGSIPHPVSIPGSSPAPSASAQGSSPIAFKRNEIDDSIADALLSPTDERDRPTPAPAPAHAPPQSPKPPAEPTPTFTPAAPAAPAAAEIKPKAKPTHSGRSISAPKPKRPSKKAQKANNAAGPSTTATSREQPIPLPADSAFYNEEMDDLATDVDLGSVLPRLVRRQRFWQDSDDDEPALDLVREKRRRLKGTPPYRADGDDYDSLDEDMPPIGSQRVVAETALPEHPGAVMPVLSRTRWQARYMMSKAKIMLLSEENDMRRKELESTLREEMELDLKL